MNPRRTPPRAVTRSTVAALVAVSVAGGCAGKRSARSAAPESPPPIEQWRLAELKPVLALPAAATQPTSRPTGEVLELYAQGRDALLNNRKQAAVEKLQAAADLDTASAIVFRDLGYALMGVDNVRAADTFRRAIAFNPHDADSRVQLARLLSNSVPPREDEAIEQLRLARLSTDYDTADGLSAVTDLLLGRLLELKGYRTAALECFELVLATVDRRSIELRGRPELVELLQRPGVLTLKIADLSAATSKPDRAIELYERLREQEPQAAAMLELRIARAHMDAGRTDEATQRGFNVVETFRSNRSARAAFAKLFDRIGLDRGLQALDRIPAAGASRSTLDILRADFQLRLAKPEQAIASLKRFERFDVNAARLSVRAYRDAGKETELVQELISRTATAPNRWPAINRAWAILTQTGQPAPLTAKAIESAVIPKAHEAARQFVLAQVLSSRGQPAPARRAIAEAQRLNAPLVQTLLAQPESDFDLSVDYADPDDLVELILDYRDDAQLLNLTSAALIRQGQKSVLASALQKANAKLPADTTIAGAYAQVLVLDEQKPEALAVIERAVQQAASASELYVLSGQYTAMGDLKAAEQVLRRALAVDSNNASVCNDLGYMLADDGRELDFAESLLWRAVGAEVENPAYLDSLGWLLYKRGRFVDASQYLEQAVAASEPADPVVLDHSADALHRIDKPDLARQRWTQAVEAIRQRGTSDPQLRLRIEQKLRQANAGQNVDVAPIAK